ncbi:hypothetical protein DFH29DRAFT_879369 [Suillus ampliporus]|nr:hypothetical protein DFH29DRAFT_879369 [Suillus ampliporus]
MLPPIVQNTLSTVARGTAFEQRSLQVLQQYFSMSLKRVGGKSDGGVDLLGWWWLPLSDSQSTPITLHRRRIRVLGTSVKQKRRNSRQTTFAKWKAYGTCTLRPAPNHCPNWAQLPFSSQSQNSPPATLTRVLGSSVPFLLMHLPPPTSPVPDSCAENALGEVGSAFWNPALGGAHGLLRGELDVRWEHDLAGGGRPGLWCHDKRVQNWTPDTCGISSQVQDN